MFVLYVCCLFVRGGKAILIFFFFFFPPNHFASEWTSGFIVIITIKNELSKNYTSLIAAMFLSPVCVGRSVMTTTLLD